MLFPNPYILSTAVSFQRGSDVSRKIIFFNTISLCAWQKSQVIQNHSSTKEEPKYISTLCAAALSVIHIKYHPLFIEQKRDPEYLGQFSCFFWELLSDPFVSKCWGQRAVEFFEGYLAFYHCSLNLTYKSQAICSLRKLCFTSIRTISLITMLLEKTSSIYLHIKIQVRIIFSGHISWHNRSESGSLYTILLYSASIILIKTRNIAHIENRNHALDLQTASCKILCKSCWLDTSTQKLHSKTASPVLLDSANTVGTKR